MDRASEEGLRPVHYMGNKSRFLDVIDAVVDEVARPGSTACDLFAGTAVVARRLAQRRPVICADIQAYSQVLARALTAPRKFSTREVEELLRVAREWLSDHQPALRDLLSLEYWALSNASTYPDPLADVIEFGSFAVVGHASSQLEAAKHRARNGLDPKMATLTWYYGGVYFSYRQALELDAFRNALKESRDAERDSTAVAALLGTARIRKLARPLRVAATFHPSVHGDPGRLPRHPFNAAGRHGGHLRGPSLHTRSLQPLLPRARNHCVGRRSRCHARTRNFSAKPRALPGAPASIAIQHPDAGEARIPRVVCSREAARRADRTFILTNERGYESEARDEACVDPGTRGACR